MSERRLVQGAFESANDPRPCRGSWPGQLSTGSFGYFGHSGSASPRSHIENVEPRPERTVRW